MLLKRILVAIVLLPIGVALILLGGLPYALMVALILGIAAWEYVQLFHAGGLRPSGVLVVAGTLLFAFARALSGFESSDWLVSLMVLASMAYHLVAFERGRDQSATDFAVTLAGILYMGWIGAYLISLRNLPEGKWWVLMVLPAVWLADSGAYFVGRSFGRHKMSPRLSPNKSWEGYLGGVLVATLGGALLAMVWSIWTGPGSDITPFRGAIMGFVLAVVTPLGDLGESMIKRQVGVKDSGKLLPGHGGAFDRIDSWLWAGVIGYYLIAWLVYGYPFGIFQW
jgi:phosphatidate cytidylyltransferase